ncbi:hypothetical protein [Kitasatospora sp. NPDC085879]|uniref:hypothetical protein n=1 Tax=Kitasatospora sp. NPDC085879 TaxID=3154769 RepID=UPI00341BAFF0
MFDDQAGQFSREDLLSLAHEKGLEHVERLVKDYVTCAEIFTEMIEEENRRLQEKIDRLLAELEDL